MAIAARGNKQKVIRSNNIDINPRVRSFVSKNIKTESGKRELLKEFGDRFISGFSSGSELLIDIIFETSSFENKTRLKAEIGGAVKGLASGKAGYEKLISSAHSHKNITARLIGIDGSGVPKDFDANEVYDQIVSFFTSPDRPSVILKYDDRRFRDIVLDNSPLDWVIERELSIRKGFVNSVQWALETLDNTIVDSDYVSRNIPEFTPEVVDRAHDDAMAIRGWRSKIEIRATEALSEFRDTGLTDTKLFNRQDILDLVPPNLQTYPQVGPNPPAPQQRRNSRSGITIQGPFGIGPKIRIGF